MPGIEQVKTMEDVRSRGREKIYQNIDKAVDFLAPLADPEGLWKVTKNRVEQKTVDTLWNAAEKIDQTADRYVFQPWNRTKEFARQKAEAFVRFSTVLGFRGAGRVEAAVQRCSQAIDGVREMVAVQREKKVVKQEAKLQKLIDKAREARVTVSETKKSTAKMTTIREMAASL